MSLSIASLNSGSNGNCYYVGNDREAILVDAGLSCREIERRMERLGLSMGLVAGIFISHEHDDHIRGVEVLSKRHKIPVYISEATLLGGRLSLDKRLVRSLDGVVAVGDLAVTAFSKAHDASDPCSFVVACGGIRIGVFTDIGIVCDNLIRHFMRCHAAILETNYDEQMLEEGRYPYPLKKRIRGGQGHLSNRQALELFMEYRPAYLSHLLLAHLSQDNNSPELVQRLFEAQARGTKIVVASRYQETGVFVVDGTHTGDAGPQWNEEGLTRSKAAPEAAPTPAETLPISAAALRRRKALAAKATAATIQIDLFNQDPC
jgi:phosphoribosyl 1,2-cyclic phosphodiesterase